MGSSHSIPSCFLCYGGKRSNAPIAYRCHRLVHLPDHSYRAFYLPRTSVSSLVGFGRLHKGKLNSPNPHLNEGTHFHYKGKGKAVPIFPHANGNGIDVDAKVGHVAGRFLVDSGNQTGTFLSSTFVTENDLVHKLNARYRGYNGRGFGGDSPAAWYVRLPSVDIAGLRVKGPVMRLQTADDSFNNKLAGNIGQDILQRFVVTVDCKRAVMFLEKTPGWNKPATFNRVGLLVDFNHDSDEVKTVLPGSPAGVAGLMPGDRILTINGAKPSDDPNEPLFRQPVGTVLHLQVQRGADRRDYDVSLRDLL